MGRASPGSGGDLVTDQLWQPLCSTPQILSVTQNLFSIPSLHLL